MKKILFGLGLVCSAALSQAQTMFDGIVVEKYHTATVADHAADANLPVGAVTYRIYADLKTGYKMSTVYGDGNHAMIFSTTTSFYNSANGSTTPNGMNNPSGTDKYDSWVSMGAAAKNKLGVLLSDDNSDGVVDGMTAGTPSNVTLTPGLDLGIFDGTPGNTFTVSGEGFASLTGAVGPTTSNMILIAQITTDGVFHYELNIQVVDNDGNAELYVSSNPLAGEFTNTSLTGSYAPNVVPTVNITAPVAGSTALTGDVVTISANAADLGGVGGAISKVEFFVGGVSIGVDNSEPYSVDWTPATVGSKSITAVATDNEGASTTSAAVSVSVSAPAANIKPTVSISTPSNGTSVNIPATVNIVATAADADGSVANVEFFVNGTSIGSDASAPYSIDWTAIEGTADITAVATDNKGATTTSGKITITVFDPAGAPYQIISGKAACAASDFIYMPVKRVVDSLKNVIGFDLVMTFDKSKVTPTGIIKVNSDLVSDSLFTSYAVNVKDTSLNISLFLNASAPAGTTFNALGQVLCVEFVKTAAFAANDTAVFTIPSIVESYNTSTVTKMVKTGNFVTYKDTNFVGALKYWSDNSPIAYDAANPSEHLITNIAGAKGAAIQPDVNGMFNFNINNGAKIAISRDIDATTDVMPVINGYDALLTQKVLVEDAAFIPNIYQILAMDVNMDGKISAGDVSQINQRTVLTLPEFNQKWNAGTSKASKDWLFVDEKTVIEDLSYRISNKYPADDLKGFSKNRVPSVVDSLDLGIDATGSCPVFEGKTFKAILIGDANGSFKNLTKANTSNYSSLKSDLISENSISSTNGMVTFDLSKATASNGYIDIPVYFSSNSDVHSLDFAINYNSNLTFNKIVTTSAGLKSLAYFNENDQTLRFTSDDFTPLSENAPVVIVRFAMNNDKILASDVSKTKAYLNGEESQSAVTEVTGGVWNNNTTQVVDVYPNPTRTILNVKVSQNATVQMFDMTGKLVIEIPALNANDVQQINIENLPDGVYTMKVFNEKGTDIIKVVKK